MKARRHFPAVTVAALALAACGRNLGSEQKSQFVDPP